MTAPQWDLGNDLAEFMASLGEITEQMIEDAFEGLVDAGEHILDESNERVPLLTGELRNSGTVTHDKGQRKVAVAYDAPHAVDQHEIPIPHANGREFKYLEKSALEAKETTLSLVKAKAGRSLT